jgi:hypothetical protein
LLHDIFGYLHQGIRAPGDTSTRRSRTDWAWSFRAFQITCSPGPQTPAAVVAGKAGAGGRSQPGLAALGRTGGTPPPPPAWGLEGLGPNAAACSSAGRPVSQYQTLPQGYREQFQRLQPSWDGLLAEFRVSLRQGGD